MPTHDDDKRAVIKWLFSSDTGASSECLAAEFLGVEPERVSAPRDPADLGRCLRLIEKVPAVRQCVDRLAAKHAEWMKAAAVWDKIAHSMKKEVGIHWDDPTKRASDTYQLMKQAGL